MKRLVPALILAAVTTVAPVASGTAWAAKSCPGGSHRDKGPDPKMVYCYDNLDPTQIVKVFNA